MSEGSLHNLRLDVCDHMPDLCLPSTGLKPVGFVKSMNVNGCVLIVLFCNRYGPCW